MTNKRRSRQAQGGGASGAGGQGAGPGTKAEPEDAPPADAPLSSDTDSDTDGDTRTPKCPHAKKAVDINKARRGFRGAQDAGCRRCEGNQRAALCVCLKCGAPLCAEVHAPEHMATPHSDYHALAISLDGHEVRCYLCEAAVPPDHTKQLLELVEFFRRVRPARPQTEAPLPMQAPPVLAPLPGPSCPPASAPAAAPGPGRIRGLSNLGNTCFFNSVLQCLVQTPYLVEVLHEMAEAGETFTLPGGDLASAGAGDGDGDGKQKLPPIRGELKQWGSLTEKLANTIRELQNSVSSGVYNPRELHSVLVRKMTQFGGGDQHDSHELMRHLLEAVRSEDLKRYRQVILNELGLATNTRPSDVDEVTKQKIKFYDQQASDKMLRPEQVFRGFLVSTLECQECGHTSNRSEYFLDLSLPVVADKPQPPALSRRRSQDDSFTCLGASEDDKPSKHQLKKEKQAAKKAARKNKRNSIHNAVNNVNGPSEEPVDNKSSSEHSDADCEDNVEEPTKPQNGRSQRSPDTAANFSVYLESGYNSEKPISSDSIRASPVELDQKEKADNTPERTDKEICSVTPNCLSATAIPLDYLPHSIAGSPSPTNPDSGVASPETAKHLSLSDTVNANTDSLLNNKDLESPVSSSSPHQSDFEQTFNAGLNVVLNNFTKERNEQTSSDLENVSERIKGMNMDEPPQLISPDTLYKKDLSPFNNRPYSICSRYQNDNEGYSVQSCLNQFTSSELLTGNNKVGCEACTKRANNGKTVYTNATKRFLISSPPAILILHLKRFQFGSRYMLSKLTKHVNFSTILDLGPFCSDAAKHGPHGSQNRRNIYSLYGVVEHCGGMHSGHYVAYVKVRSHVNTDDKRWSFLPTSGNTSNDSAEVVNGNNDDTDSSLSGYESGEAGSGCPDIEPPPGKWYYASDSLVQEVSEDKVLKAKAYLLFYERIL